MLLILRRNWIIVSRSPPAPTAERRTPHLAALRTLATHHALATHRTLATYRTLAHALEARAFATHRTLARALATRALARAHLHMRARHTAPTKVPIGGAVGLLLADS